MTNYNERLDELMPCDCKFLKGFAWRKGDPCEGCINGRLKQAITSLIKELVAEVRNEAQNELLYNGQMTLYTEPQVEQIMAEQFDKGYDAGRNEKAPSIVEAVEFRREQYGWDKAKMSAMLDMSQPHYSEFLHGKRGLPLNSIRKAYAIGIPPQVLLQDTRLDNITKQLENEGEE